MSWSLALHVISSLREPGARALKCSATSQDSNAEYSSEVATPQNRRPTKSTQKAFQCLVKQPMVYVTTYVSAAFLRPLRTQQQDRHSSKW